MQSLVVVLFSLAIIVVGVAAVVVGSGNSGPDPAKWLLHQSGFYALCFLVMTLAVSPLSRTLRVPKVVLWRRPVGLAGFFFATIHVVVYVSFYQAFLLSAIVDDIAKRPYILIGFFAWILLIPLAATSTRRARRSMGMAWNTLHRCVYIIIPLAIIHQGMAQKADVGQTLIFLALAGCFLIERAVRTDK